MKDFQLGRLTQREIVEFKREMQKAFQYGYEIEFGRCDVPILPEEDIDQSLDVEGAIAYAAWHEGSMVGGAIVKIDPETRHNSLELLFVKVGIQSKGLGQAIWNKIEQLHPETKEWETFTPYFEKRNIHFYVNCCGFHIVEFFNPHHKFPPKEGDHHGGMAEEVGQYFLRFVKKMTC